MAKKAKKPNGKRPVYKYQPPQSETVEEGQYVGDNVIPIKQKKGRIRSFSDSNPSTTQQETNMDIEGQFKNESFGEEDQALGDTVEETVSENVQPASPASKKTSRMSFGKKLTLGVAGALTAVAVISIVARKKPQAVTEGANALGQIAASGFKAATKPSLFKSNIG